MTPVQLSWGNGLTTFATNRRNNKEADVPKLRELGQLKGPVDHEVPVLALRDRARQGAGHRVRLRLPCDGAELLLWCGDYPGFAQLALEKRYPEATALFFAGCGADQNPLPRRSVDLAEAMASNSPTRSTWSSRPPWRRQSVAEDELARMSIFPSANCRRAKNWSRTPGQGSLPCRAGQALLKEFEKNGALKATYPYPVQAWQLGDELTWIALGGEVVVDYSFG